MAHEPQWGLEVTAGDARMPNTPGLRVGALGESTDPVQWVVTGNM
jgi:hypothetical protein